MSRQFMSTMDSSHVTNKDGTIAGKAYFSYTRRGEGTSKWILVIGEDWWEFALSSKLIAFAEEKGYEVI